MSKKIGYCGNHCEYCFFTDCNGCKSKNPSDSYANLFDDKKCPNAACCQNKQFDGCWQCDKLNTCDTGFYRSGEKDAKAYALYIKEYGVEKYTDTILKLMRTGYDYPRDLKNVNDIDEILKIMKSAGF